MCNISILYITNTIILEINFNLDSHKTEILFPTTLHFLNYPSNDIPLLTEEIYKIRKNNPKTIVKSNVGGYHTPESTNLTQNPKFFNFLNFIKYFFLKKYDSYANVYDMWGIISGKYCYNGLHSHLLNSYVGDKNKHWSGVLYLKTPKNCGSITFHSHQNLNAGKDVMPYESLLLLFPSYVYHSVRPNLSDENRVVVSFNLNIISKDKYENRSNKSN